MANDENTASHELLRGASGGPRPTAGAQPRDPDPDLHDNVTIPLPRRGYLGGMPQPRRPGGAPSYRPEPLEAPLTLPPDDDAGWGPPARHRALGPRRLHDERDVGTLVVRVDRKPQRGKLVVALGLFVLAGIAVGGTIALRARSELPDRAATTSAASPPPVAQPAAPQPIAPPPPVTAPAEPAAAAAVAAAPAPALVEVRIDSTPSGATVMLVDRGKTQLLGTTPISAAVDPSREYDVVLTYPSRPTRALHLDPRTTRRMDIVLEDRREPVARPADVPPRRSERPAPRPAPVAERTPSPPPRAEPAEVGEGTLMIASKPPCEILIDGKPTGLTTPQRSITRPAGRHQVTLVNAEKQIRKTLTVQITAGGTEKVIEDLMTE